MIKVLFVNAAERFSEVANRFRPLWPAYLAAFAKKHIGNGQVEFTYLSGQLESALRSYRPDIVGLSAVTQNYHMAVEYAAQAKKHGATVIVGGIHISLLPGTLTSAMDVGVFCEGEETFVELLRIFIRDGVLRQAELASVKGIVYHEGGQKRITPPRPQIKALDDLSQPDRSLIGYQRHDYMFTSRGCPYRCVFCASCRYWDKVRYHSPEYVVNQIGELVDHGVNLITFYDDLFIGNVPRLRQISEMTVKRGYHKKCQFHCSGRANLITREIVEYLKAMNVTSVGMGLESGCERILKYLKGHVTVADNTNAVNLLKAAGLEANASFVIGAPDESEAEMMETYRFIKTSRIDFVAVYVLTPLPGTPVWEYALKRGLVSENMDWSLLNVNFETHPDRAIILSELLDRRQLSAIYRKFRRLRLYMILKALPHSSLLRDVPLAVMRLLFERIDRFVKRLRASGIRRPT